jgi:hypothetical protein
MLANHFSKIVVVSFPSTNFSTVPKNTIDSCYTDGAGPYTYNVYSRSKAKNIVIAPDQKHDTKIKIKLSINPNKNHYINKAEMRKVPASGCRCCFFSARKAVTQGAGNKSSRKTKGRRKREKQILDPEDFSIKYKYIDPTHRIHESFEF